LYGLGGDDIYYYGVGFGNDRISESSSDTGADVIKLIGIVSSDVSFTRQSNDLLITIVATGEVLAISNQFNGTNGIEQVLFADGTTWDRSQMQAAAWIVGTSSGETLYGSADADTLDGLAGNDNVRGGGSGDTYIYGSGSGNDTISESSSDAGTDIVKLAGLTSLDLVFNRSGNDLIIQIGATGETLKVENQFNGTNGIEQLVFADNTTWDRAEIAAQAWINGTTANDTLNGTSGDDVFNGGLGDDRFNSGAGNDTYIYALGDGNDYIDDESGSTTEIDTLRLTNLNASDLTFSRIGVHLIVTVNSNGQTITLDEQFYSQSANWGLEKVEFADGSSWNRAMLNSNAWYRGTNGNDTISGSSWDDTFKGGLGDDRFNSGQGSDTYVYSLGDGNDYIDDESGSTTDEDTLRFTDLNASDLTFSRVGVHLVVKVNSNGQTITLDEQFYSQTDYWGLEKIEFANGSSWDRATLNSNAWYRGTSGNDTISGSSWNDTIYGDGGNDTLSGGSGDDAFIFRAGSGQDTITDFSAGHDVLEFRDGLFADSTAAFAAASASGNDTIVTIDASTSVLLQNVALASLHVDDFRVV
jgi:Ca2+-binding RTX toxin-like protein